MNKLNHIIFDLDGTIIDSKPEILQTYIEVFREVPPSVSPDITSLDFSLTLNDLLKSVYDNEKDKIAAAKKIFSSIYDISDYNHTVLYEGAAEVLNALVNEGFKLYIATNKRYLPTLRILGKKEIKHLFSNIMASDMVAGTTYSKQEMISEIKRLGMFTEGYMVGDSALDIIAGKAEDLLTIAVNYGYEKEDTLLAAAPAKMAISFQNLYTLLAGNG